MGTKRLLNMRPILFFSIIMFIKVNLAWMVIFDNGPSWSTIFKEIPFILILFTMIEWFSSKRKLHYYVLANLLLTTILFAVIMYYKYYGVIVTYVALDQVNQVTAVRNSVFSLLAPYYLLIFSDILIFAYLLFRRNAWQQFKKISRQRFSRRVLLSVLSLSLALCLFNILPNKASMNENVKTEQMGIFNYEAYAIVSGVVSSEEDVVPVEEITRQQIANLKQLESDAQPAYHGAAKGKNLVLIQMESFQNFLVNLKIDGQEITPVMNELVRNSHYFPHFYQQVGAGNTSDAEFVVNSSFYVPASGAASQNYADKVLPSLPRALGNNGYDTATFHTNVVEFWNRGDLYRALGFNRYYDADFFGEEDAIFFGASDEQLYGQTIDELDTMNQQVAPFYAHIISMTAHHPFTIPVEKHRITLPERYQNNMVGNYIVSQNYADYALGQFIADLKQRGIWEDSLIVLYGDHLGLPIYSLTADELTLMEEIYGRPYELKDMINIPFLLLNPTEQPQSDQPTGQVHTQIGGQVDIMPTLLNWLGIDLGEQVYFGQDLFNQHVNLLPQRYYLPSGSFISSQELFTSGSGFEDGSHYPIVGDGIDQTEASEEDFLCALELLRLSDSYASQLPSWKQPAVHE